MDTITLETLVQLIGAPAAIALFIWYHTRGSTPKRDPAEQILKELRMVNENVRQVENRMTRVEVILEERSKQ